MYIGEVLFSAKTGVKLTSTKEVSVLASATSGNVALTGWFIFV
jgi:hypothetical protein